MIQMAQWVKNASAMQETRVQILGWEESMATNSSVLAWRIPCTEEPGRSQRIGHEWSNWAHDPNWFNLEDEIEDEVPGDYLEFRLTSLWKKKYRRKRNQWWEIFASQRGNLGVCVRKEIPSYTEGICLCRRRTLKLLDSREKYGLNCR